MNDSELIIIFLNERGKSYTLLYFYTGQEVVFNNLFNYYRYRNDECIQSKLF